MNENKYDEDPIDSIFEGIRKMVEEGDYDEELDLIACDYPSHPEPKTRTTSSSRLKRVQLDTTEKLEPKLNKSDILDQKAAIIGRVILQLVDYMVKLEVSDKTNTKKETEIKGY